MQAPASCVELTLQLNINTYVVHMFTEFDEQFSIQKYHTIFVNFTIYFTQMISKIA